MKQNLVLASSNKNKVKEIKAMFEEYNVLSLDDIGFEDEIIEDGSTFLENSSIKANAVFNFLKEKNMDCNVIADDSGLCVDALGGAPGIYSARFSGDHDFVKNRKKLLEELESKDNRHAHFECCVVWIKPSGETEHFTGICEGEILTEEVGDKSFGYNCLFFSSELQKCFGLATLEERNSVSHRGKAIRALKQAMERETN